MPAQLRGGARTGGGVIGYPLGRLYEEVAFIAYYFHWAHDLLLDMEHAERRLWVEQISRINGEPGESRSPLPERARATAGVHHAVSTPVQHATTARNPIGPLPAAVRMHAVRRAHLRPIGPRVPGIGRGAAVRTSVSAEGPFTRHRHVALALSVPMSPGRDVPPSRFVAASRPPLARASQVPQDESAPAAAAPPSLVDRLFDGGPLERVDLRVLPPSRPEPDRVPPHPARAGGHGSPNDAPSHARPPLGRGEIGAVAEKVLKIIRSQQRLERESKGLL